MSEWKKQAVARRVFRQTRGEPEIARRRNRRPCWGCKKSRDGQHDLGPREEYSFNTTDERATPVGYSMQQCKLCGKKIWGNLS